MAQSSSRHRTARTWRRLCRCRKFAILVAALPLFQATGCFPDPVGGLNFSLQLFINSTLVNAVNTIVRNFLNL